MHVINLSLKAKYCRQELIHSEQRDESESKHLFTGAVFNNGQFTFTTADAGSAAVYYAIVPQKKFKRILPFVNSDDELFITFVIVIYRNWSCHNRLTTFP